MFGVLFVVAALCLVAAAYHFTWKTTYVCGMRARYRRSRWGWVFVALAVLFSAVAVLSSPVAGGLR